MPGAKEMVVKHAWNRGLGGRGALGQRLWLKGLGKCGEAQSQLAGVELPQIRTDPWDTAGLPSFPGTTASFAAMEASIEITVFNRTLRALLPMLCALSACCKCAGGAPGAEARRARVAAVCTKRRGRRWQQTCRKTAWISQCLWDAVK